jgi:predicted nuclease of predicted toxin-antitoxin system
VKLLFDENLSRKLVVRLAELYPNSIHVAQAGLLKARIARYGSLPRQGIS